MSMNISGFGAGNNYSYKSIDKRSFGGSYGRGIYDDARTKDVV